MPSTAGRSSVDALARRVVAALSDDLRKPAYRGDPNPLRGHC